MGPIDRQAPSEQRLCGGVFSNFEEHKYSRSISLLSEQVRGRPTNPGSHVAGGLGTVLTPLTEAWGEKIKKPASLLPFIESQNWTSYYLKRGANNAHSFSCKNKFLGPSRSLELSNLLEFGMEIQHLILSWTLLCRPPSPVSRSTTPRALLQTNKVFCVVCIK